MVFLYMFITSGLSFLFLKFNKHLYKIETVLLFIVNGMIQIEFIFITTTNLEVIIVNKDPITAVTVLYNRLLFLPLITLFVVSAYLNISSRVKRIIIFCFSTISLSSFLYLSELFHLVKLKQWRFSYSLFYWFSILLINLIVVLHYRKMLKESGVIDESNSDAPKV